MISGGILGQLTTAKFNFAVLNTIIPINADIMFNWSLNTGILSASALNNSQVGTGFTGGAGFFDGGFHDPALSYYGITGSLGTFPTPVNVGGVVSNGGNNWILRKDAHVGTEEIFWNVSGSHTKALFAGYMQFGINPANNTASTNLDHINIDFTGGPGGFAIGQENFTGGHTHGLEVGNPTGFGATSPVNSGSTYWYNLYVDTLNGVASGSATWSMWDPNSNWNQVGQESMGKIGGTTVLDFKLCSWNTNFITTGSTLFGAFYGCYDNNAIFPSQAVLGLRHPDNISATVLNFTGSTLSWSTVAQATNYNVDQSSDGGSTWSRIQTNYSSTSLNVTGLTSGVSYLFRVSSNLPGSLTSNTANSNVVVPATVDMVGWWKMGDVNSGTAADFSGNGNTATFPNGGSQVTGVGGTGHAALMPKSGFSFAEVASPNSALQIVGSITITTWVNFTNLPAGGGTILTMVDHSATGQGYTFYYSDNTVNGTIAIVNANFSDIAQALPTISAGTWHFYVMVFDAVNKTMTIYIDGTLAGGPSGTADGSITNPSAPFYMGVSTTFVGPGSALIDGAMQDTRVFNRTMSSAEQLAMFNAGAAST